MQTLTFRTNLLTGSIPAEITSLTNLRTLALNNNQLTGSIPTDIGNCGELRTLYLYGNLLSGSLPPGLFTLTNLTNLQIYGNQFYGTISEDIGNLTALTTLDFSNNELIGSIPAQLGAITPLTTLILSGNNLSGEIPEGLKTLTNLTTNKTSTLVFSSAVKSVDRGSRDILARKAPEMENVLQIKANRENFPETNLTVITSDGLIRQFTVNYAENPAELLVNFETGEQNAVPQSSPQLIFREQMTQSDLDQCAERLLETDKVFMLKYTREYKIAIMLRGIYIKDDVMFFHFTLHNTSNINYDVGFLRFFITDREKVRRTASQEVGVRPIYTYGDDSGITANSDHDVIYAFEKFTIPDAKNLVIEMFEQKGGRNLSLAIKNKSIVNARLVPR